METSTFKTTSVQVPAEAKNGNGPDRESRGMHYGWVDVVSAGAKLEKEKTGRCEVSPLAPRRSSPRASRAAPGLWRHSLGRTAAESGPSLEILGYNGGGDGHGLCLCVSMRGALECIWGLCALNQTVTDALAEKGSLRAEWPGPSRIREPSTAMIAEGHLQGRFPGFRAVAKFKAPGHRSLVKERIPCSRRPRLQINHLPKYLESELRKKQAEETLRTGAHVPYRTGSAAVSFKVTASTNNECRRAQHSPGSRCVPRGLQLRLCLWQELRERPAVEGFEASRCQGVGSPDFTPSLKFLHRPCAAEARWAKAGSPRCSSVGGRYSEL